LLLFGIGRRVHVARQAMEVRTHAAKEVEGGGRHHGGVGEGCFDALSPEYENVYVFEQGFPFSPTSLFAAAH